MIIAVGSGVIVMIGPHVGIMVGIGSTIVVMFASLASRGSSDGVVEQNVRRDLKPRRVVVAIAVKHRRSRERLHGQSQHEQGDSEPAEAFTHEKIIALSKPMLLRKHWLPH